ncbi:hypothetical protein pb186bvf_011925 [Paramecium bursaria]
MEYQDLSFTFGDLGCSKHPQISKCSPFYKMQKKPLSEQKPRVLRLFSPNKENLNKRAISIKQMATSPIEAPSQKELTIKFMQFFQQQKKLYDQLLIQPENTVIQQQKI